MTWGKRCTNFPIFGESAYQSFSVFGVLRFQAGVCPSCLLEQSRHSGSNPMRGCQETNSPLPSSKGRLFGLHPARRRRLHGCHILSVSCFRSWSGGRLAHMLVAGNPPGRSQLGASECLPGRVCLSIQPAQIAQPGQTLLPAPPTGCCRRSGSLQIPGQMCRKAGFLKPQDVGVTGVIDHLKTFLSDLLPV